MYMELSNRPSPLSLEVLLADYSRWLDFLTASGSTLRGFDRQLADISKRYTDLSDLSNYLRACMNHRSQFYGALAIQLAGKVAQLRAHPTDTEPANDNLLRRLTHAHPFMQELMTEIANAMVDISQSYQALFLAPKNAKNGQLTSVKAELHQP